MSSFPERLAKSFLSRIFKEVFDKIFKGRERKRTEKETSNLKTHPWRPCSMGESWVRTHSLTVPPSERSTGGQTTRRGHCRKNKTERNICTADELHEIAIRHFKELVNNEAALPVADPVGFSKGNKYDLSIGGWTKFWNEALEAKDPLSPDLVKALIASESDFEIPADVKSNAGPARGLIQITETTRRILQDPRGEIKDYLIEMTADESRDPEVNIAAGTRWLHHKKYLAKHRLKREATWEEAIAEYKGILSQLGRNQKADDIMAKLRAYYERLKAKRE